MIHAEVALHNGDAAPWFVTWSRKEAFTDPAAWLAAAGGIDA